MAIVGVTLDIAGVVLNAANAKYVQLSNQLNTLRQGNIVLTEDVLPTPSTIEECLERLQDYNVKIKSLEEALARNTIITSEESRAFAMLAIEMGLLQPEVVDVVALP